jgi:hypothetical protein
MWTTTATPPVDRSVKVAQPRTFDPLRGSMVARACAPAGGALVDVDAQPAVMRAAAAATAASAAARVPVLVVFIFPPSRFR